MRLKKFDEIVEVNSLQELQEHLLFRYEDTFGAFWLWHECGTELGIMVNGPDAYLFHVSACSDNQAPPELGTYVPEARTYSGDSASPALHSSFAPDTQTPDEEIEFLADNYEPTPMPKLYIVPLSETNAAIDEFFLTGQRSAAIQWHLLVPYRPAHPKPKPWWRFW